MVNKAIFLLAFTLLCIMGYSLSLPTPHLSLITGFFVGVYVICFWEKVVDFFSWVGKCITGFFSWLSSL